MASTLKQANRQNFHVWNSHRQCACTAISHNAARSALSQQQLFLKRYSKLCVKW